MANTYSTDLEKSSSQFWSITDAAQTGLDITGDITLEAWVKIESDPGTSGDDAFRAIISKYRGNNDNRSYAFRYWNNSGTKKLTFASSNNGVALQELSVNYTASTATWIHLAISYDASESTAKFYVNGSQQGTDQVGTQTSIFNGTARFCVGALDVEEQWFDGLIDEARVWSDVRTEEEIAANYNKELVGDEANLVGYWKFNNDGLDETSNNNDLTNNASATFSADVPFTGGLANVKSYNGLALASIKSINGLAIGSIKNINGLN
jgi:hypothetical protein